MECRCLPRLGAARHLVCPQMCPHGQRCSGLPANTAAAVWRGRSATRSVGPDAASTHTLPPAPPQARAPLQYSQREGWYAAVCRPAGKTEGQWALQLTPAATQAGHHAQAHIVQPVTRTTADRLPDRLSGGWEEVLSISTDLPRSMASLRTPVPGR